MAHSPGPAEAGSGAFSSLETVERQREDIYALIERLGEAEDATAEAEARGRKRSGLAFLLGCFATMLAEDIGQWLADLVVGL